MFNKHATDNPRINPLGNLDNPTLRAAFAVDAGHAYQRPVAVENFPHLVLIKENVSTAVVRYQEPVTIRMPLNTSGRQAGPLGQDVGTLAIAHELAFTLHGA